MLEKDNTMATVVGWLKNTIENIYLHLVLATPYPQHQADHPSPLSEVALRIEAEADRRLGEHLIIILIRQTLQMAKMANPR